MINYITKTIRSVPNEHWPVYWILSAFWIFSIGYAYYHCMVLGLPFLAVPALHIITGGIALSTTLTLRLITWGNS